jgi:hypothetical protein
MDFFQTGIFRGFSLYIIYLSKRPLYIDARGVGVCAAPRARSAAKTHEFLNDRNSIELPRKKRTEFRGTTRDRQPSTTACPGCWVIGTNKVKVGGEENNILY